MPNTREKLIKRLEQSLIDQETGREMRFVGGDTPIISHGVTFAEDNNVPSKWISVSERLPTVEDANEEGVVLVRNIGCPMYEAMDWDQVEMFRSGISHWISLPEPPKD